MIWHCTACKEARDAMSAWMFGGPESPVPRVEAKANGHAHLVGAPPHRLPDRAPLLLYHDEGLTEWLACYCGWTGLSGELLLIAQAADGSAATFGCPRCRRPIFLLRDPQPSEIGQRVGRALSSPYADHG